MTGTTIGENLKLLASYYKSVAEVCRRLDINRQQFNKYLSGRTLPSRHTLQRICDFFGVEDYELMLPSDEFRDLVALKPNRGATEPAGSDPLSRHTDRLFAAARSEAERYAGTYFVYRYSFSDPDLVQKSIVRIWPEGNRILSKRMERFDEPESGEKDPFLCKYLGYLLHLHDRLYVIEYDTLRRREVSQTILYPGNRNRITWLSGLNMGASTRDDRRIGCARTLYQYLGRRVNLTRAIGHLGKFPAENDEIPKMVRETIGTSGRGSNSDALFALPL